jgi:outer membrane protein assembly factor BamD
VIVDTNRVSATALIALCAASLLVSSCAGDRARRERVVYQERPVELLFSTGARRLDQRRWEDAIVYFEGGRAPAPLFGMVAPGDS